MSLALPTGVGAAVRPISSYEEFSYEAGRLRPADLGWCRDMVRSGLSYGWSRLRSRKNGVEHWEINSARNCDVPVVAHYRGVLRPGLSTETFYASGEPRAVPARLPTGVREYLVSTVRRCRHCGPCLRSRSVHWAKRAEAEYAANACTWLGTVTLSPFHHARLDAAVARKARVAGEDMRQWEPKRLFRERCAAMGDLITLWLKRVRQAEVRRRSLVRQYCGLPPRIKILIVAEEHRSEKTSTTMVGRPHYHVLIHEALPYELIRADEYYVTQKGVVRVADTAMVRSHWQLGFTQFELCRDVRSASYLCKYLSKDMLWRVRASKAYGKNLAGLGMSAPEKLPYSPSNRRATCEVAPKGRRLSVEAKPDVKPEQAVVHPSGQGPVGPAQRSEHGTT